MSISFFDDKTAVGYRIAVVSFDDDYYYGQLYRLYEGGLKQFLCNVKMDLDEAVCVTYMSQYGPRPDRQTYIDLEVDHTDKWCEDLLLERLDKCLVGCENTIFDALKKHGKTINLVLV